MKSNVPEGGTFRDHRFFLALFFVNVVVARIAMRVYGEQFVLLQHAISDLGATITADGLPNRRSPWVFLAQMVISGAMCLRYARNLAKLPADSRDHRVWLLRMCGAGFLLMPAPHNLPVTHYVHMFGGAFIFFSLWMLSMIYLSEGRKLGNRGRFWIGMILLQATVLSYALFFAVDHESKQVAQGIGLAGLLAVLVWSTQALARSESHAQPAGENTSDVAAST